MMIRRNLEEDETIFEGKSWARIGLEFVSDRRIRHRGASKKFDDLSGRESCGEVGHVVRVSMKVFGRKSTATRDGEGGALIQLNNPGLKICNSDRTK